MFNLALLRSSTARIWCTAVPAEPGITELAFRAIKWAVEMSTQEIVCALMLDEMAMAKTSWRAENGHYCLYINNVKVTAENDYHY